MTDGDVNVEPIALSAQRRSALRKFRLGIEFRTVTITDYFYRNHKIIERVKDDAIRTVPSGNETIT
jgi:hypothetical protein